MHTKKLAILAALGGSVLVGCSDDGALTTTGATEATTSGATTGEATTSPTSTTQTSTPTTAATGATTAASEPTTDGPGTTGEPGTTGGVTTGLTTGGETTGQATTETTGGGTTGGTTGDTGGDTEDTGGDTVGTTGDGTTGAAESCEDAVLNQDETDVDCGGSLCGPCQADQVCTSNEDCITQACVAGTCVMPACTTDIECVMLEDQCNTGVCNLDTFTCEPQPVMDGVLCDDDELCTLTSTCVAGTCEAGAAVDCAAQNTQCGIGACDPQDGMCKTEADPDKEGMACNDNNACTVGETCAAGTCGDPNDLGYVFHENFSNPAPGWVLDVNWEFGAAKVSPAGGGNTGTDPALDHTPTDDNKLAGQLIGGLVNSMNQPNGAFRCLTSPKVNTANLMTAWVTFWRHLHSDYTNFGVNRIEVWDGAKWVLLEQGYAAPVTNDLAWKEIKFDISAYKNADLQVRICNARNSGAYSYGGWSVDDFTIAAIACTP